MRRILPVPAAAIPVLVLAALTAGDGQVIEINHHDTISQVSYINAAHCAGTEEFALEWKITPIEGQTFSATGTFQIYASDTAPPTSGDTANFCPEQDDTTNKVHAGSVPGGSGTVTAQIQQLRTLKAADAVAKAGMTCDSSSELKELFICSHWSPTAASEDKDKGFASGTFKIQVEPPAKPTITNIGPGDTRLDVSWDAGTGTVEIDHFVIEASEGGTVISSVEATGGDDSATVSGLVNGTTYQVTVTAYSLGGNTTESDSVDGIPIPAADFWDVYKDRKGAEAGGCSSSSSGLLALVGAASLLLVRRRKP